MARILGVDYGRKKIGLALADNISLLATPLRVLRPLSSQDAISRIAEVVKQEQIDEVVVGVSEGEMAEESEGFSKALEETLSLPVHLTDETLSTTEAKAFSIKAGLKRKKRREMEDAFAATILLQNYLDILP